MERLAIDGYGRFLGTELGQIVVKEKGKVIERKNPLTLRQIVFSGKGSISSEAVRLLGAHGVEVLFLDFDGSVVARVSPPMLKTVSVRKEQYFAYQDERGVLLSKEFVKAKMRNQIALLGGLAKHRKDTQPDIASQIQDMRTHVEKQTETLEKISGSCIDEVRDVIQGIEGSASSHYWKGFSLIIPEEFAFSTRSGRYAADPVNSMLNYGYGILQGEVLRAIHFTGLDPYAGYLHVDRSGRSSLVLDFMEEFRQQTIDKVVVRLVTRGQVRDKDFEMKEGLCRIRKEGRKLLLKEILERFEDFVRIENQRIAWCNVILKQARLITTFLRGQGAYTGFYLRW
ncbi:MAG: CRISPR-associated endonuclease Cas1 [Theionarchaea archaeon]|nr:CRISPR-associated endonuclease Cas1 [Theionarchaea archaeon]